MSGYDPKTGIFQLNESKMCRYIRGKNYNKGKIWEAGVTEYCAELFRKAGYNVLRLHAYGLDVVADDAQVWEVLSDSPATFGKTSPPATEVYEAWLRNQESK
jgi:hypothetical protein